MTITDRPDVDLTDLFDPDPDHPIGMPGPDPVPSGPQPRSPESLCGPDDLQDVEQYDGTLGVTREFVRRRATPVCRIVWNTDLSAYDRPGNVAGRAFCTGSLIAPNVVLTAAHCFEFFPTRNWVYPFDNRTGRRIDADEVAVNMHVEFGYQLDANGVLRDAVSYPITALIERRPGGLDAAIIQIAGSPGGRFGWNEVAEREPQRNEPACIIQHPRGVPKKIEAGPVGFVDADRIGYGDIDTEGGSSGAPVLDRLGRIIGVHTTGLCGNRDHRRNYGVRIDRVLAESSLLREVVARIRHSDVAGGHAPMMVWSEDPDGNGYDNVALASLGPQGHVRRLANPLNEIEAGHQLRPRVASAGQRYAVVWEDDQDENDYYNINVVGFDVQGRRTFDRFEPHTRGAGQQLAPSIGMAWDGSFVVAWQDDRDRNGYYNIDVRGFHADGSEKFSTRQAHRNGTGQQLRPEVAVAANGSFVVVWEDDRENDGAMSIRARTFDANGTPTSDDLVVNDELRRNQQTAPAVAISPRGTFFVAAWESDSDANRFANVRLRSFSIADGGREVIDEIQAHRNGTGQQRRPAVAIRDNGEVTVAWETDRDRDGHTDVLVRRLRADGSERVSDRRAHSLGGRFRNPSLSVLNRGDLVIGSERHVGNGVYRPVISVMSQSGRRHFATRQL